LVNVDYSIGVVDQPINAVDHMFDVVDQLISGTVNSYAWKN